MGQYDAPRREPRRPIDVLIHAFWIARRHRFRRDLASLPEGVEAVALPTGATQGTRIFDFSRTAEMIAAAHAATTAALASS